MGEWLTPSPSRLTPGNDPVPIVYETPGPDWTGADYFAPNAITSPDHSASKESLNLHTYLFSMTKVRQRALLSQTAQWLLGEPAGFNSKTFLRFAHTTHLCVFSGFPNTQRFCFPQTTLICVYNIGGVCLLRGTT